MLNNYACTLPPLANVNCSAFHNTFCQPCKSTTGKMAPKMAPIWQWGPDMAPTVNTRLSRAYMYHSGIWVHIHIIATLNSNICIFLLLYLSFCHHS